MNHFNCVNIKHLCLNMNVKFFGCWMRLTSKTKQRISNRHIHTTLFYLM